MWGSVSEREGIERGKTVIITAKFVKFTFFLVLKMVTFVTKLHIFNLLNTPIKNDVY